MEREKKMREERILLRYQNFILKNHIGSDKYQLK